MSQLQLQVRTQVRHQLERFLIYPMVVQTGSLISQEVNNQIESQVGRKIWETVELNIAYTMEFQVKEQLELHE